MEDLQLDFHTHLVPRVDDGSRGDAETLSMARGLAELGVRCAVLTPHQFRCGNRFDRGALQRHADHVRRLLADGGVPLRVVAGAEYCLGPEFLRAMQEDELFGFEWSGRPHLLAELPPNRPFTGAKVTARLLVERGLVPVLAHPERYSLAHREWRALRDAGWRFQLNLLSLVGRYGHAPRTAARALLERDLVDFTGSDIHRPADLDALREARGIYRTLTAGVPA